MTTYERPPLWNNGVYQLRERPDNGLTITYEDTALVHLNESDIAELLNALRRVRRQQARALVGLPLRKGSSLG